MNDLLIIPVYVAILIIPAIVFLVARDRIEQFIWNRRNPPEKLAADRRVYEQRILSPDWDRYRAHLGREAPSALMAAYRDQSLVLATNLEFQHPDDDEQDGGWWVRFEALDQNASGELVDETTSVLRVFSDMFGSPIYLRPGPHEMDAVYTTHHDGGDTELLAPDIETFLRLIRRAD